MDDDNCPVFVALAVEGFGLFVFTIITSWLFAVALPFRSPGFVLASALSGCAAMLIGFRLFRRLREMIEADDHPDDR